MPGNPTLSFTLVRVSGDRVRDDVQYVEGLDSPQHQTLVPFGTCSGDFHQGLEHLPRSGAADDCRDPELPRDNRGVRGAASLLGDDQRRLLHQGLPVRRRQLGDQDVTGIEDAIGGGDVIERLACRQAVSE